MLSDVPLLVVPTENTSLEAATRYLRSALFYALLAHPDAESVEFQLLRALDGLAADANAESFRDALAAEPLTALLESTLDRLVCYLALAQTREAAERDLGHALAFVWSHLLDVWPRYLGAFDHDERRWFHHRHEQRGTKPAESVPEGQAQELVKALQDLAKLDGDHPRVRRAAATTASERLGIPVDIEPAAARHAYRRLWEGLRRDSPLTTQVLDHVLRERIIHDLEDANRQLRLPSAEPAAPAVDVPAPAGEEAQAQAPGDRLRERRMDLELSVRELSLQTKIGLRHLEAIERFELDSLPRPVYLRGYLREIANVLGIDAERFMDDCGTTQDGSGLTLGQFWETPRLCTSGSSN